MPGNIFSSQIFVASITQLRSVCRSPRSRQLGFHGDNVWQRAETTWPRNGRRRLQRLVATAHARKYVWGRRGRITTADGLGSAIVFSIDGWRQRNDPKPDECWSPALIRNNGKLQTVRNTTTSTLAGAHAANMQQNKQQNTDEQNNSQTYQNKCPDN